MVVRMNNCLIIATCRIERFHCRGLKEYGQYGKIDNLNITLNGNRVERVADDAAPLLYKGALDFTDNTGGGTGYTYDGDGRLTGDKNRGIAKIDYEPLAIPAACSLRTAALRNTFTPPLARSCEPFTARLRQT